MIDLLEHFKFADGVLGRRMDEGIEKSDFLVESFIPFCSFAQYRERIYPPLLRSWSALDYWWDLEWSDADIFHDIFPRFLPLVLGHDLDFVL